MKHCAQFSGHLHWLRSLVLLAPLSAGLPAAPLLVVGVDAAAVVPSLL